MKVAKTKWKQNIMSDCIKTVKVKDAVQKKDYQRYGQYPIISQEKDFISGYCDSIENLNSIGEVVIFGDHTRVLKFVDFDFCVGADGVKVIRPNSDISTKYLFHFLKWVDIPSNGYSRHFKFLKELNISYPSLSIQQAITSELDAIQTMIDGYKAQLEDLDALAQSIFLDMFGDPVSNPKGWKIKKLEDISEIISGFAFPSGDFSDTNPVKAIKITNVGVGEFIFDNSSLPLRYKETDAFSAHFGDIALALTRTVISSGLKRAIVPEDYEGSLINQRVAVIRGTLVNQSILYHYLGTEYVKFYVQKHAAALMQPNLSINDLRQLPIFVPHLTLQQQFSQQVEAIDEQKKRIRFQLQDAETLMAERTQYYFS